MVMTATSVSRANDIQHAASRYWSNNLSPTVYDLLLWSRNRAGRPIVVFLATTPYDNVMLQSDSK
jgi:hypothetical protein